MGKRKVEEIVEDITQPIVDKYGFEFVGIEYVKEGANWFLRAYIDKLGGITIDDCSIVSNELSKKLDEADPIPGSYYLEVSSPGLERPLKKDSDFKRYAGELVQVKTFSAVDGQKEFEGILVGLIDGNIEIRQNEEILKFPRTDIASVKRAFKF